MNTRTLVTASAVGLFSSLASLARADFVVVDLSSGVNADLRTYSNGGAYPVGGQTLDFGGVPFSLGLRFDDPSSLGAVQTNGIGIEEAHSFAVNIPGALRVYTLINSAFGSPDVSNGLVEVFGTNGAYAALELVQGFNIRDHNQSVYQNDISDPSVFSTDFGGVRLDRQVLELGPSFAGETVTELRFSGGPVSSFLDGVPFLAAATFDAIPAPGAVAAGCLALLAAARRRR